MGNAPFQGPVWKKASMISADDAEYPREYHTMGGGGGGGGAGGSGRRFSSSGLIHTSSARSLEALTNLQKAEMDALAKLHKADIERQRDAHYKSRQQASATATATTLVNTNSARQQQQPNYWSFKARTPRHSQPSPVSLADQAGRVSFASAESLETMSESDVPLGFSRMNRLRQSLPLARSPSQTKLRAPGVLFLQLGDEVRRVHITHELTSLETLHALLVHMFPQKLTMGGAL
ncbi:hypothetical protein AALO_G00280410 [Alosa alosa]|uniref:Uncharacterized protein n=2 Tax=Alosa alosa TaxID=278164 RepID=A0AAV6FKD6_9TELE|nr:hypothetical protein AALO_G00280410 [Alosa alosa]